MSRGGFDVGVSGRGGGEKEKTCLLWIHAAADDVHAVFSLITGYGAAGMLRRQRRNVTDSQTRLVATVLLLLLATLAHY